MPTKGETIRIMSVILQEIGRAPLSRSILRKRAFLKGISSATFEAVFDFLINDGNVEKCSQEHRAPYRITGKGLKFLAWRLIPKNAQ